MKNIELIITEQGAQSLAESKFKPFIPSQRRENDKKQLAEMFKKNFVASANKKELAKN